MNHGGLQEKNIVLGMCTHSIFCYADTRNLQCIIYCTCIWHADK